MSHDMGQMGQPMQGMARDSMSPSMGTDMSAMVALHKRMMADPVIRQRIMADSVMRRLMTRMMDSTGAAQREPTGGTAGKPGAQKPPSAKEHRGHREQMRKPSGRSRPPAKPPAPRPAKPDSSAAPPHDQHSTLYRWGRSWDDQWIALMVHPSALRLRTIDSAPVAFTGLPR